MAQWLRAQALLTRISQLIPSTLTYTALLLLTLAHMSYENFASSESH